MRATHLLALLVQAADKASQGIVICDADGTVLLRNAPARDLVNARDGDLLADKAIEAALGRALTGSYHEETLDLYSPTRHTLEIRAYPLREGASLLGAVALVDDVSELRRLEAVRRDFVANLSHELKTPLGALSLLAETLDGEEDSDVVSRLTARVGAEATRFSRIVDDLLDLSRIEAGGTGTLAPVAVSAVIDEVVDGFYDQAAARQISLEVTPTGPYLFVMANRRDLTSAVSNLVDNAIKYSPEGAAVDVNASREKDNVVITLRNGGPGIPPDELPHVFERFYRGRNSRSQPGNGLGLSLSRAIVRAHGGQLSVTSRENVLTTFTLMLPCSSGRRSS